MVLLVDTYLYLPYKNYLPTIASYSLVKYFRMGILKAELLKTEDFRCFKVAPIVTLGDLFQ